MPGPGLFTGIIRRHWRRRIPYGLRPRIAKVSVLSVPLRPSPSLFSYNGLSLISHFLRPISSPSASVGTHYNRCLINAAIKIDSQILHRRGRESESASTRRHFRYLAALCMDAFVEVSVVDASTPRNGDNNVFTVPFLPLPLAAAAAERASSRITYSCCCRSGSGK